MNEIIKDSNGIVYGWRGISRKSTDVNEEPEEVYGYVPNVERLPRSQVNEAAVLQVHLLSLIVCCMNGTDVSVAAGALLPELPFAEPVNEPVFILKRFLSRFLFLASNRYHRSGARATETSSME